MVLWTLLSESKDGDHCLDDYSHGWLLWLFRWTEAVKIDFKLSSGRVFPRSSFYKNKLRDSVWTIRTVVSSRVLPVYYLLRSGRIYSRRLSSGRTCPCTVLCVNRLRDLSSGRLEPGSTPGTSLGRWNKVGESRYDVVYDGRVPRWLIVLYLGVFHGPPSVWRHVWIIVRLTDVWE